MGSKPQNLSEAIDELGRLAGETGADLKSKLENELRDLEEKIEKLKPRLENLKETATHEVQKNPWAAVGIVGLIFFVLGFLFASRGGSERR
jgi:ElaB/YqjD/DUF883 family membrane-anchored ribosome-binding protein